MKTDPDGNAIGDNLPQPGQGLHGETMGGPQPLMKRTPTGPGGIPNTDAAPSLENLPMQVTQAEIAHKNREYWEPSWGRQAGEAENQAPPITRGPKADQI